MCSVFLLTFLPLLCSDVPLLPRQSNSTGPFVLRAFQPGSPIHLSSVNANDGHFWLGKATSSACPAALEPDCPTGTETALAVSVAGYANLYASVPAGQDIYVAKDGALSFTEAHDEEGVGSIAYPSGFSYDDSVDACASAGAFTFSGTTSKGWLACPVAANGNGNGPWQVYADIKRTNATGCLAFEARGERYEGVGVWQYN